MGLDRREHTGGFESSAQAVGFVFTDELPGRGDALSRGRREATKGRALWSPQKAGEKQRHIILLFQHVIC